MTTRPNPLDYRQPDYPIDPLFLRRWSPRAMSGETVPDERLMTLFEAARWAPSTYNEQEWRFLYARRNSEYWSLFFELLMEANQAWCHKAAVLVALLSHRRFERNGNPNPVHSFDAGTAFENLALQATLLDLVVHPMAGFRRSKAQTALHIPDDYHIDIMIAIGQPGSIDDLPPELREREVPSTRKPVREIAFAGTFPS